MKIQVTNRELFVLLLVSLMSFLANLPENIGSNLIDRKLLLLTLGAVIVIAMFRYLQILLLLIISILAVGANLPKELAQYLGVSQTALIVSLVILVAITLLNRVFNLIPTNTEPLEASEPDDALNLDSTAVREYLLAAISKGDIATLSKLLAANAGINFTLNGTTPLHLATEKGYSNIVQLLIDHGADFLMVNAEGETPLDVALAKKKFARTTDILFSATMPYISKSAKIDMVISDD